MHTVKNIFKYKDLAVSVAFSVILFSILFFSCNKRVSDNTQSTIENDSIVIKMSILQDSVSAAWNNMIKDDDEKLGYMRRLLLEISYSNFNPEKNKELNELVGELKALRYDQNTMQSSALIDQYDSATNIVSRQVIEFAYDFPGIEESDLINELINEINQKNNYVLIYRVHYDEFAEQINFMIDNYGAILEEKGVKTEKLPLFKLPMDEI